MRQNLVADIVVPTSIKLLISTDDHKVWYFVLWVLYCIYSLKIGTTHFSSCMMSALPRRGFYGAFFRKPTEDSSEHS